MDKFERDLTGLYPDLTRFARSLTGNTDEAADLVQDTLMKAVAGRGGYTMGTNLKAWVFMILRNQFYSNMRRMKYRRTLSLDDDLNPIQIAGVSGNQLDVIELKETFVAISQLPETQQVALLHVGMEGRAYIETSDMINVAVGTVKSRVSRARKALADRLQNGRNEYISESDLDPILPSDEERTVRREHPLAFLRANGFNLQLAQTSNSGRNSVRTFVLQGSR